MHNAPANPSTAISALPSVGPLLGAAYDRGVATVIRSWRVVAILLVIECVIASVPSVAQSNLGNLLIFSWAFYAMANAIRTVFDPDYRMNNRTAGEMFAAGFLIGITIVLVNVMVIVTLLRAALNDFTWVLAIPGIVVGFWLYARWLCGPALGARGMPAIKALRESWRLTSAAFWPTLVIPCANFIVSLAIGLVIGGGARLLLNVTPGSVAAPITIVATVLVLASQLYASQAAALSVCMWLKALQDTQLTEVPAT